jgi:hypothetical protein
MSKYGNWETAWKRNVELAAHVTKPLDVVLLGDSITEFWLGTSLGVPVPERGENAEAFRDLFTKKGGGHVEGLALGIAGDRVSQHYVSVVPSSCRPNFPTSVCAAYFSVQQCDIPVAKRRVTYKFES